MFTPLTLPAIAAASACTHKHRIHIHICAYVHMYVCLLCHKTNLLSLPTLRLRNFLPQIIAFILFWPGSGRSASLQAHEYPHGTLTLTHSLTTIHIYIHLPHACVQHLLISYNTKMG